MEFVLQIWGGLFYLTNKICFAFAEGVAIFYDYERKHGCIDDYSK